MNKYFPTIKTLNRARPKRNAHIRRMVRVKVVAGKVEAVTCLCAQSAGVPVQADGSRISLNELGEARMKMKGVVAIIGAGQLHLLSLLLLMAS